MYAQLDYRPKNVTKRGYVKLDKKVYLHAC